MKRILLAFLLMCILTTLPPAAAEDPLLKEHLCYPTQIVLLPVKLVIDHADDMPALEFDLQLPVAQITWGFCMLQDSNGVYCGGYLDEAYPKITPIEMPQVEVSEAAIEWPETVCFIGRGAAWQVDLSGTCHVTYAAVVHLNAKGQVTMAEERTEEVSFDQSFFGP